MKHCLSAALCALSAAAAAQSPLQELGIDSIAAKQFYQQVAAAVHQDDVDAVAALVRYPLYYGNDDNRTSKTPSSVADETAMRAHYRDIFTDTIKRVLACRTPADFSANRSGIVIGDGSLWFAPDYIDSGEAARPLTGAADGGSWQLRIAAVYDGAHARRDAKQCEAQKQ